MLVSWLSFASVRCRAARLEPLRLELPEKPVETVAMQAKIGSRFDIPRPLARNRDRLDHARRLVRHQDHAVRQHQRLIDVVGHEDDGPAGLFPDRDHLGAEPASRVEIERGEGFVHEDDLRLDRERAGDGNTLALAPGQHARKFVGILREPDEIEQGAAARFALKLSAAAEAQLHGEHDIAEGGAPRHEARRLKDVGDPVPSLRWRPTVDANLAFCRRQKAADQAQAGRLAAARGAENAKKLAAPHREIERLIDALARELDRDLLESDDGVAGLYWRQRLIPAPRELPHSFTR